MINWHDLNLSKDTKIKVVHVVEIRNILDMIEPLLCKMEHTAVNINAELTNYNDHRITVETSKQFTDNGIFNSNIYLYHNSFNWISNQVTNNKTIRISVKNNNYQDDKYSNDMTVENDHHDNQYIEDNFTILTDVKSQLHLSHHSKKETSFDNTVQISEYPSANRYVYLSHFENDFSNFNENN